MTYFLRLQQKYPFIAALLWIAVGMVIGLSIRQITHRIQITACPMDAQICPDGSSVGRVGPECTFAVCPAVVATSSLPETVRWIHVTDPKSGVLWAYPETFGTNFISLAKWPPTFTIQKNTPFSCDATGTSIETQGETRLVSSHGQSFCQTEQQEGAAGSIYTNYTYTFARGTDLASFAFTVRSVQCGNYDEPQKSACEAERAALDVMRMVREMRGRMK
jgi:hypothetical protein